MHDSAGNLIAEQKRQLAEKLVSRQFSEHPDLERRYGAHGRQKCLEDAEYHFASLAEAVRFDCAPLFLDYIGWAKIVLTALKIPDEDLERHLQAMVKVVHEALPAEARDLAEPQIHAALERLPRMPAETTSFLKPDNPKIELARQWLEALLKRDGPGARRLILKAAAEGAAISDLYTLVFAPALQEIGRLWQIRKIDEALEHYCSEMTHTTLALLSTYADTLPKNKVALGLCVASEQHNLGLRLALDCLQLDGWHPVFLGANVPSRNIPQILLNWAPNVLIVSATMPYHLPESRRIAAAVRTAASSPPMIIVGGRPFDLCPDLWRKVGADGHGRNFTETVHLANTLVKPPSRS